MGKVTSDMVKERAREQGADIVGIASAERLDGEPEGFKPADLLPGAKSVVSIGIRQLRSYMEKAPNTMYFMFGYRQKNDYINQISWSIAHLLDSAGYYALPIQAYGEGELFVDTQARPGRAERRQKAKAQMRGSFAHVNAAVKAGLGEIGLNGLFLSRQYGPRVHLGSVITTAPLEPDPLFEGNLCDSENCRECLKQCPAGAIGADGKLSDIDCLIALDKLSTNYEETVRKMLESQADEEPLKRAAWAIGYSDFEGIGFCGIPCINACPVGRKELK